MFKKFKLIIVVEMLVYCYQYLDSIEIKNKY